MSTENNTGIQTRAMAQWVDNEANPELLQRAEDPAMNPTVELHRTKEDAIEEFIQQHGTINLDWYVPDLCNTNKEKALTGDHGRQNTIQQPSTK